MRPADNVIIRMLERETGMEMTCLAHKFTIFKEAFRNVGARLVGVPLDNRAGPVTRVIMAVARWERVHRCGRA